VEKETVMKISKLLLALSLLAPLAIACGPSAKLASPNGFAHVGGDYDDRITNAHGVVVGARVEKNEPQANLDFWVEAVDLRLKARGYEADGEAADVKNASGIPGRSLHYKRGWYRYWIDVYATEKRVVVVEATGDARDFDAAKTSVEASMRSVRVN
jgi:hypothetical protein